MTDYSKLLRRPFHKRLVIWILGQSSLNAVLVKLLRSLGFGRSWWHKVPVVNGFGRLKLPDGMEIKMQNPARCNVSRELYWNDGKLSSKADHNALILALNLSQDAEYFLDVGSYTGIFSLAVSRCNPDINCHAFEIVPDNFLLLWQNVITNDLISSINVHFKGASDALGSITMPESFSAGLLPSSASLDSKTPNGIKIPVQNIDQMIDAREVKAVIKIDVEGFEWNVLNGARNFIKSSRPDIICEFLRRAPDILEITNYLNALGYNFFRITGDGLFYSDTIIPVKTERDWLLTTRGSSDLKEMGWNIL